jgi:hypothetical protein
MVKRIKVVKRDIEESKQDLYVKKQGGVKKEK